MKQQDRTYQTYDIMHLDRKVARAVEREAAIEAVQRNGLHQIREVERSCFEEMPETYGTFCERLACLRAAEAAHRR